MPDEKLPLIAQAGVPAGIAALLQLAMALAIGKIPPTAQMVGAVIVAGLVGGGVSVLCAEGLHLSSTISGIIGGATGAVPAVFWAGVAQSVARQQVKQRFGVDQPGAAPPTDPQTTEENSHA